MQHVASTDWGNTYYKHKPTGACYEVYTASRTLVSQTIMNDIGPIISSEDGSVKLAKVTEAHHCKKQHA